MRSDEFLDVAARIGHELAAAAIWHDGRCTWIGATPGGAAALEPDLYGGTAGVALFLAHAATALDDVRLRGTALGAIRHALAHARRIAPPVADGLYGGVPGIAYAGAHVARLTGTSDAAARALLRRARPRSPHCDVASGVAGAVLGLVALGEGDAAIPLGDTLLARARKRPGGWSWPSPGPRGLHDLCGYAHGAAGIGHALAELATGTGEARFAIAAGQAFAYEREWLDPRTGTWPDLRDIARRAGRDVPLPVSDSWCHGAPGIALSRLRAAALLDDPALPGDTAVALARTGRHAEELLRGVPDDASLCHGSAGIADVLIDTPGRGPALAARLGRRGIAHFAGPPTRFPGGLPAGATPGLMLGTSGIGLGYLRLAGAPVPSALLITPVDNALGTSLESKPRERSVLPCRGTGFPTTIRSTIG